MFTDSDAERRALGGVLLEPSTMDVIQDIVQVDDFIGQYQTIYRAMVSLHGRNVPIDAVTIAEYLNDTGEDVNVLAIAEMFDDVPSSAYAEHAAQRVADLARKRRLREAMHRQLQTMEQEPQLTSAELLAGIGQTIEQINTYQDKEVTPWVDAVEAGAERIAHYADGAVGYQSGLVDVDTTLNGFEPGDYIIIAADSSHGKTTFAAELSRRFAKQQVPILIISLETEASRLASRIIAREKQLSYQDFSEKPDVSDMVEYPIYIRDAARITNYRSFVQRMVSKYDIKIVVIDHLQIFTGGDEDSRTLQLEHISQDIRGATKDLNLVTLALSQVTDCEGRIPRKSDIRWNRDIAHHADKVMTLTQAKKLKNKDMDINGESIRGMITDFEKASIGLVDKNRDGPTGFFYLYTDFRTFTFDNFAQWRRE